MESIEEGSRERPLTVPKFIEPRVTGTNWVREALPGVCVARRGPGSWVGITLFKVIFRVNFGGNLELGLK